MGDHQAQANQNEKSVEKTDRRMFDFLHRNDDDKLPKDVAVVDPGMANEVKKTEDKPTLVEHLHRSDSNSSSSSDEDENGEKKKKKKGLKDKIKEKMSGEKEETAVHVEKHDDTPNEDATNPDEKKGFLEKVKEKLPGHHQKKPEGCASAECAVPHGQSPEGEPKKGIFEKIKEKIPGCHKNEDEKDN